MPHGTMSARSGRRRQGRGLLAPAPRQRRERRLPARRITVRAIAHRPEPVSARITPRRVREPPDLLAAVHGGVVPAINSTSSSRRLGNGHEKPPTNALPAKLIASRSRGIACPPFEPLSGTLPVAHPSLKTALSGRSYATHRRPCPARELGGEVQPPHQNPPATLAESLSAYL